MKSVMNKKFQLSELWQTAMLLMRCVCTKWAEENDVLCNDVLVLKRLQESVFDKMFKSKKKQPSMIIYNKITLSNTCT